MEGQHGHVVLEVRDMERSEDALISDDELGALLRAREHEQPPQMTAGELATLQAHAATQFVGSGSIAMTTR